MAAGINFRNSAGYVTDGTNETYCIGDGYPTTRGGFTFGFSTGFATSNYDVSTTPDRRLAGMSIYEPASSTIYFRIDLPTGAGTYDIRLALGALTHDGYMTADYGLQDGTTEFATIGPRTPPNNNIVDAANNNRTSASDWVTNNVAVRRTFTDTYFRVRMTTSATQLSGIIHLFVSDEITGGGPTLVSVGGTMALGDIVGTLSRVVNRGLTGGITPSAGLSRQPNIGLGGNVTPAASVNRQTSTLLTGGITPAGGLAWVKVVLVSLSGAIASIVGEISSLWIEYVPPSPLEGLMNWFRRRRRR